MSISDPVTRLEKPTRKYIYFKNGAFSYYDKDKKENINVPLPVRFVILDELTTVSGWHESSESGIYSNEVHNQRDEELFVKSFKGGDIAEGIYSEIKDKIKSEGGRFTKSVYALMDGEIVNFQFMGSSFAQWLEKNNDKDKLKTFTINVKELGDGKKGATKYKFPVFEYVEDKENEIQKAIELDATLQEYFKEYKKQRDQKSEEDLSVTEASEILLEDWDKAKNVPKINYESEIKAKDLPF